jgi:eukaryotic-like serine/threonine-protein kinase
LQPNPADRPDSMKSVVAMLTDQSAPPGRRDAQAPAKRPAKRKRWLVAALACIALLAGAGGSLFYFQPELLTQVLPSAGQPAKDQSTAKGPGPTLQPPALQGPQSPSSPALAPPPSPPLEPNKDVAMTPPAAIRPPAPASAATLPSARLSRIDTITRYVNDYDGGDCFFATAISVGETAARIEGFGASTAPFQTLDDNFKKTNGFEADIGVRQVTPSQCPAITFLSRVRSQRQAAPQLDIGQTSLKSGQSLTGTIDGYGDRNVELLLVSDDGSVNNITRLVKTTRDSKTFNLRMSLSGTTAAQPQILLVVASGSPLATLQLPQPADAAKAFPAALDEAARTKQAVAATARYFKLE